VRALVTGATGFIGSHVAERLRREGHEVRGLVRGGKRVHGVENVAGDLTEPSSLRRAAAGCDAVFHCAALVSDWATVEEIVAANVFGTRNLVRAAGDARLVFLSSTDVYGRGTNWYAESKRLAEAELPPGATILRPATVYGPRSVGVVGEIAAALRGGYMLLIDRGRANAGLTYVENVVDAALLAPAGVFTVTDELDVTWRRFTDDLAAGLGGHRARLSLPLGAATALATALETGYRAARRATGLTLPPLLSRQAVHVLGTDQSFTAAELRAAGWAPRVGYEAGLAATLSWLTASRP
jgi:nucleoside-diphosphate-sugar epimerase